MAKPRTARTVRPKARAQRPARGRPGWVRWTALLAALAIAVALILAFTTTGGRRRSMRGPAITVDGGPVTGASARSGPGTGTWLASW